MSFWNDLFILIRTHWKPAIVIILAPFAYLTADKLGTFTSSNSWMIWIGLVATLIIGDSLWKAWRYATKHLLAPNLHTSYDEYYDEGEYRVVPMGSIKGEIGCWQGGEGTVVAPRTFFREWKDKGGMILFARPVLVNQDKLPEVVRKVVGNPWYKGVKQPFYYTETPVVPMSLLDVSSAVYAKIVSDLPASIPSDGDGAKTLAEIKTAIDGKMEDWDEWRKGLERKMVEEMRRLDKGKESKIMYLNQKDEFLSKIIDGKHEAFVELADLDAAVTAIPRKRGRERIKEVVGREERLSE